jgi:uncharacterized protein YndB with AHSA1/START domain
LESGSACWTPNPKARPCSSTPVHQLTFEDTGNGKTKYTARVRHWTVADREAHEKMGFHQGWAIATNQLEALAQKL